MTPKFKTRDVAKSLKNALHFNYLSVNLQGIFTAWLSRFPLNFFVPADKIRRF
jgi:hypothetical protein